MGGEDAGIPARRTHKEVLDKCFKYRGITENMLRINSKPTPNILILQELFSIICSCIDELARRGEDTPDRVDTQ